jgi:hypothetical protein
MPLMESLKNMFRGSSCGCTANKRTRKNKKRTYKKNKRGGYRTGTNHSKMSRPSLSKKNRSPVAA